MSLSVSHSEACRIAISTVSFIFSSADKSVTAAGAMRLTYRCLSLVFRQLAFSLFLSPSAQRIIISHRLTASPQPLSSGASQQRRSGGFSPPTPTFLPFSVDPKAIRYHQETLININASGVFQKWASIPDLAGIHLRFLKSKVQMSLLVNMS